MARFPDLLRQRHRRRLGRAEEICREGRRGRLQKGADRRRARTNSSRSSRASSWWSRRSSGYWRKTPSVKRIVIKSIPDESTRLAALKRGEVDGIYWIRGELAEELQRTPGLTLAVGHTASHWLYFPEQWDPKSPWHDVRVRQAANLGDRPHRHQRGDDRSAMRCCTDNAFVPAHFEFYWQPPPPVYRPGQGEAAAGRGGPSQRLRRRRRSTATPPSRMSARRWSTACGEVGIRANLRPIERAAFFKGYSEKKYNGLIMGGSAAFGNAATRLERSSSRAAPTPMAAIPISTRCSSSRRSSSTTRSARRCCTRCSSSCTKRSSPRRSGSWRLLSGVGPRVGEVEASALIAGLSLDLALRGHHAQGRLSVADRRVDLALRMPMTRSAGPAYSSARLRLEQEPHGAGYGHVFWRRRRPVARPQRVHVTRRDLLALAALGLAAGVPRVAVAAAPKAS